MDTELILDEIIIYRITLFDSKIYKVCDKLTGTSDPYCLFYSIKNEDDSGGNEIKTLLLKTKVIKKSLTPVWNIAESFSILKKDNIKSIQIEVYDENMAFKDEYIGSYKIDITKSFQGYPYTSEISNFKQFSQLIGIYDKKNTCTGEVNLIIAKLESNNENLLNCLNYNKK